MKMQTWSCVWLCLESSDTKLTKKKVWSTTVMAPSSGKSLFLANQDTLPFWRFGDLLSNLLLAFAPMKPDLFPVRLERALPVLASRGPRAATCAACVCPARPAAVEGWRPPSGCCPQWPRTSVVCISSPSRSPRSESQRRLSPGHTEGGAVENLRERFNNFCLACCTLRT